MSDPERKTLAEIGKRLGRKALQEVAQIVTPDTILGWYRKLIARKFDGSRKRHAPGRPRTKEEVEELVLRIARENRTWGYRRIQGALRNLGIELSAQTVGNILERHDLPPVPERRKGTTWKEFIEAHLDVLGACDFFTAEVLTLKGLLTYYVLFFIHLSTRKVQIAGITPYRNRPANTIWRRVAGQPRIRQSEGGSRWRMRRRLRVSVTTRRRRALSERSTGGGFLRASGRAD